MNAENESISVAPADPSTAHQVLWTQFNLIDYAMAFDTIEQWRSQGRREYIAISNPHSVMLCRRDAKMGQATDEAALTLPDGAGIILAANMLKYPHYGRVTGPTLMLRLCDWGRKLGYRHYFYGGAEGVAKKLAENLAAAYPGLEVAGTYCPPFRKLSEAEDAADVERINQAKPDIVWVGLGAPKQEKWMHDHVGRVDAAAMIGVGAAFDFHSGNVKWTPPWMRTLGIEWLYRLTLEPRRMWRRNLDSPVFVAHVVGQKLGMNKGGR